MNIGTVNTSDDYTVNVRGAINDGEKVTLTAETGKTVSNNGTTSQITETTTQGKTEWSVDDCYGSENADGSINGTDCTDNIQMSGTVKTTGMYTGTVKYEAGLEAVIVERSANAKYAVSVYGVDADLDKEDGSKYSHTMTFGPATGSNYITKEKAAHIAKVNETDNDKCIHNHTWSEIVSYSKINPHVFEKCIANNCTKSIPLGISDALKSKDWTSANSAFETGDGPSMIYYELDDQWRVWQPGVGDPLYHPAHEWGDNTGGWSATRLRAVLNGTDSHTDIERANKTTIDDIPGSQRDPIPVNDISTINSSNSLLSAFPAELRASIVPKKVISAIDCNNVTEEHKITYDKLWLFSSSELGGKMIPNEGTLYARTMTDSLRTGYVAQVFNNSPNIFNSSWWLRSVAKSHDDEAGRVANDGTPDDWFYTCTSDSGIAPGFVIGA